MATQESAFESLVQAFEAALAEEYRLQGAHVAAPAYEPTEGYLTLESVEQFKDQLREYEAFQQASALAEQAVRTAKDALDAWFPAAVVAVLDQGIALVAPAAEGQIALVRHNDSYIIERAATPEEALNKIERFLNQF